MNSQTIVPFVDLIQSNLELKEQLQAVFDEVLTTGIAIGGPFVQRFEKEFAEFCGTKHSVALNSGTDALRFALIAAGITAGDAVLTVPNTFIATGEAITQAGGTCRFIDIDPATSNMSTIALANYLETACEHDSKTGLPIDRATGLRVKAIVPVHLYGQMADMEGILEIAGRYGLFVVEDACQAHGAECLLPKKSEWKTAGSVGRAAAFSFYPAKNLGAMGEGGGLTTDDDAIAAKVRMLRDHGQRQKYFHAFEGYNGRLDAVQTGILSVKLRYLAEWNASRARLAKRYNELLAEVEELALPVEPDWSRGVYHLYVIRTAVRDQLQSHLTAQGIGTGLHYPLPLHLQDAYAHLGYRKGDFPVCEEAASQILSLPMYPQLRDEQQDKVVDAIKEFYATRAAVA